MLSRFATGLAVGLYLSGAAIAADLAPIPTKATVPPAPLLDSWTFNVTPYVWVPLINGSMTVKGRTADVNVGFDDLWKIATSAEIPKDLFALMGHAEAHKGRLSFLADLIYLKIAVNGGATRTRGTDDVNATVGASAGVKVEMLIAEMAAAYEVARWGSTRGPGSGTAVDVYGGARGWWQRVDLNVAAAGTTNIGDLTRNSDGTLRAAGNVGWVDPLVGARLRHQFSPGLNLVVSGDIGGFGVGSKLTWQTIAAVNYDFYVRNSVTWSGMLGYKALYVDYSRGSGLSHYEYNMTMHGPVLGLSARF